MKTWIAISLIVSVVLGSLSGIAYASITLDNNRREYGYCPITPESMLNKAQFEINGCPIVRVYIVNWNQLSSLEQTTIDTQMRNAGFKDIGELDARTK